MDDDALVLIASTFINNKKNGSVQKLPSCDLKVGEKFSLHNSASGELQACNGLNGPSDTYSVGVVISSDGGGKRTDGSFEL